MDAVLVKRNGFYDFDIDDNGDIKTADFFDTSLIYSLLGERRASPDEVVDPQRRRGWIGNSDYENGSKIWLLYQARATRSNLNKLQDEAGKSLQWLIDDGLAISLDKISASISDSQVALTIEIRRSRDRIDHKLFILWENTGAST